MAERRDAGGNPTPSQPSARLVAFTAKLRRTVDSAHALAADDTTADHEQCVEPPARSASVRAAQRQSGHSGAHDIGTADAARRLGITANGVRDLMRRGRLVGRRAGGRWLVDAASVDAHAARTAARRAG
ncbi:helix-turn-helix domain-containing protein [Mycolicibacterium wolinskyi]|uniref:helix-turn-helix domain-containing protein n=1 Tax=Mycolicibacterium wolinskyi TaxID=59750 RepID=UPI0039177A10